MNVELWFSRFTEALERKNRSPHTVRSYGRELRRFFQFLETQGVEELGAITRDTLEEYRAHLYYQRHRGQPLHMKTQSVRLLAVKAFFRFLTQERYLLSDPAAPLELPRVPPPALPGLLGEADLRKLLEAPDRSTPEGLRDGALLETLYATGLRNEELCRLQLQDVNLRRGEVRVVRGKGGKSRVVPLGGTATRAVAAYLEKGRPAVATSWLFLNTNDEPFRPNSLIRRVHILARQAGLRQRVTPHLIRHSFATHLLRHGAGLRHLQQMLGHSSLDTTQRYTQVELTDLREVHRRCHPREQGR